MKSKAEMQFTGDSIIDNCSGAPGILREVLGSICPRYVLCQRSGVVKIVLAFCNVRPAAAPGFRLTVAPRCAGAAHGTHLDLSSMSFSEDPFIGTVVWNDLITEDLHAAHKFYGDLFGWTLARWGEMGATVWSPGRVACTSPRMTDVRSSNVTSIVLRRTSSRKLAMVNESPATVFIVDDDPFVLHGLERLLSARSYRTLCFRSGSEFLEVHDAEWPGCILIDIAMREFDGLDVQARLAEMGCRQPVIFMAGSDYGDITTGVRAMREGAVDVLTTPIEEPQLLRALEEAFDIDSSQRRARALRLDIEERLARLTRRERQVLEHVVTGRLNKQIAGDLGTVEKTIKVHRARVMQKMGVRSLVELVELVGLAGSVGVRLGPPSFSLPATRNPSKLHACRAQSADSRQG